LFSLQQPLCGYPGELIKTNGKWKLHHTPPESVAKLSLSFQTLYANAKRELKPTMDVYHKVQQ
jgi:hypothetical protein